MATLGMTRFKLIKKRGKLNKKNLPAWIYLFFSNIIFFGKVPPEIFKN